MRHKALETSKAEASRSTPSPVKTAPTTRGLQLKQKLRGMSFE